MKSWFKVLLFVIVFSFALLVYNARPLSDAEFCLQHEKVDGHRTYFVLHKKGCSEYAPFIKNRRKMLDFTKRLNYQYCLFCFDEEDITLYDAVSVYNIRKLENSGRIPEDEHERLFLRSLDTCSRGYDLFYVFDEVKKEFVIK